MSETVVSCVGLHIPCKLNITQGVGLCTHGPSSPPTHSHPTPTYPFTPTAQPIPTPTHSLTHTSPQLQPPRTLIPTPKTPQDPPLLKAFQHPHPHSPLTEQTHTHPPGITSTPPGPQLALKLLAMSCPQSATPACTPPPTLPCPPYTPPSSATNPCLPIPLRCAATAAPPITRASATLG